MKLILSAEQYTEMMEVVVERDYMGMEAKVMHTHGGQAGGGLLLQYRHGET